MDNNHILTDIREDGVAFVTLNRAEVHNAFNDAVIADLTDALRRLGADDKVRAVMLRAEGKSFSAGMFVLTACVLAIDWLVTKVENRLLVWRPQPALASN